MKKRIIIAIVVALCIIVAGVGTAIAYFSSVSGPVVNTFTVGNVELELTETTGETYQLLPGATVNKDPLVTVLKGSEESYVYVKLDRSGDLDSLVNYQLEDGWHLLGGYDGVYYRQVEYAAVNMKYSVFKNNEMTVKDDITKERMAQIDEESCAMVVTAYAIQTTAVESPAEGWRNLQMEYGR